MNMLSVLAPTSVPVDPVEGIRGQIAVAAAVKVIQVQKDMGAQVMALLDPNVGKNLNRSG
jgi:hypothetical protein